MLTLGTNRNRDVMLSVGVTIMLLHLLRNLTSLYYVLLLIYLVAIIVYASKFCRTKAYIFTVAFAFLMMGYVAIVSALNGSEYFLGMARLFYLTPFIIYFIAVPRTNKATVVIWKIFLIFIVLSCLSIMYQYYYGAISWFASSSERANTERFSSLVGSLTAFGGVVGAGFLITQFLNMNFII